MHQRLAQEPNIMNFTPFFFIFGFAFFSFEISFFISELLYNY